MQSQDKQDTFLALRGGLQGRMSLSFDLLENTLEVLQNRTADEPGSQSLQEMSELLDAALALCEHYLSGRGAYRVHGGGFAGTVQAFVPFDILESFRAGIDAVLGSGACHVLSIRPQGGVEMTVEG